MADTTIDIEYSFSSKGAEQLEKKMKELHQLEKDLDNAKRSSSKIEESVIRNKIASLNREINLRKKLVDLDTTMVKSKSSIAIASEKESQAAIKTASAYNKAKAEAVKGEQEKRQAFNATQASYAKSATEHYKAAQAYVRGKVEMASANSKVTLAEEKSNAALYRSQTERIKMYQQAMKGQSGYRASTAQTIKSNQQYANSLSDLTFNNKLGTAAAVAYLRTIRATQDAAINTAKYIFKSAINMDVMERSMNAIAGSDAPRLLAESKDIIKTMPIPMGVVADGFRKMYAAGMPPDSIKKNFLALSATANVVGYDVDRLTLAMTQMYSKGKVNAQDMRQLGEAGIGPWKLLAEKMGKSTAEVQKLSEEGKLGINEINLLIEAMGEKYIPGLSAAIDTVPGQWEVFKNRVANSSTVIQPVLDSIKDALKEINKYLEDGKIEWDELDPTLQKIIITVGSLAAAFVALKSAMILTQGIASMLKFGSAISTANTALKAGSGLFNIFAASAGGGGLSSLAVAIAAIGRGISMVASLISGGFTGALGILKSALLGVWGVIQAIAAFFGIAVGWVIVAIVAIVAIIWLLWANWDTVVKFMQDTWNALVNGLISIWNTIKPYIDLIVLWFTNAFNQAVAIFNSVLSAVVSVFTQIWNFISPILNLIASMFAATFGVLMVIFQAIWGVVLVVFTLIWEYVKFVIFMWMTYFQILFNVIWGVLQIILTVILFVFGMVYAVISSVFTAIVNNINQFLSVAVQVFTYLWGFIEPIIKLIGTIFMVIFEDVKNRVTNTINILILAFNTFWNVIEPVIKLIGVIFGAVFNSIKDSVTNAINIITNIFWKLSDAAQSVANSIRDFFTNAVDRIKGAFDGVKNFISGLNPFKLQSEFRLIGVPGELGANSESGAIDNRQVTNTQIVTRDTPTFAELAKKGYR